VVDSGCVVVSNLARQSLYTDDDRDAPKATALIERLKERFPSEVSFTFISFETVLSFYILVFTTFSSQFLPCRMDWFLKEFQ
jgi:hypothetical protein